MRSYRAPAGGCLLSLLLLGGGARAEEAKAPAAVNAAAPATAPVPASSVSPAVPTVKKGAAPQPVESLEALLPELRGKEVAAVEAAGKLAAVPGPRSLDLMLSELALGVSPKVAVVLLEGLAPRKDPKTIEVLSLYSRNRSPELRKRAVEALGAIPDGRVAPQLIAALSDGSAEVRAVAAAALGARKDKSAEPALIKLLGRKDAAAPQALGAIGGPETARQLGEMVGNVPDRLVVQTLGELLKRGDFGPDPLRLEVVKTLGKIPGPDALDVLTDYVKASAKDKARPSRAEANKIIEQRTAK